MSQTLTRRLGILMLSLLLTICAAARDKKSKPEDLTYTGTYWIEHFSSQKDAENQAVEQAIQDALTEKYGTYVDYQVITEDTDVHNTGISRPKGEVLKVLSKGPFKHTFVEGKLQITVTVKISAREKINNVQFDARLIRRPYEQEDTYRFQEEDPLYLSFKTPIDGNLAVYLEEDGMVYNLLPYPDDPNGSVEVKHNKEYLFFCEESKFFEQHRNIVAPKNYSSVLPLKLTLSSGAKQAVNRIYILFSPNPFTRALANGEEGEIPHLNSETFQWWLGTLRMDDDFENIIKTIVITKKQK